MIFGLDDGSSIAHLKSGLNALRGVILHGSCGRRTGNALAVVRRGRRLAFVRLGCRTRGVGRAAQGVFTRREIIVGACGAGSIGGQVTGVIDVRAWWA